MGFKHSDMEEMWECIAKHTGYVLHDFNYVIPNEAGKIQRQERDQWLPRAEGEVRGSEKVKLRGILGD